MPLPGIDDARPAPDRVPPGQPEDPWQAIAELRNLASLTADVAEAMSGASDLRDGLRRCADALVRGLDAAFARIWTLNDRDDVLELQASAGLYTHLDGPHGRVPVGRFKIGLIARERQPHLTNAVIGDPRVSDQDWARREGMVAFAGYPLLLDDRVVGVMALFARQPLTSATLHALATVARSIAYGIAHWRDVAALRASEERFALVLRGTDEGLWDWNVLTGEVYLGPRFKELLGYAEQELESSFAMWESRLHPEDRERTLQALRQHLEQRRPFQVEYRLRVRSGDDRWFSARGQAVWDAGGRAVRMLGSIADVTARKRGEERAAATHKVSRILAETAELTEALPRILRALCETLNWGVGEFWVRDREADVLRLAACCHLPPGSVPAFQAATEGCSFPRGVGLPGRTWAGARPEWVEDVTRDANFPRAAAAARDNLHGAVALPVVIHGEVHGVMEFFKSDLQKPDEGLLGALGDIGQQISRCAELQRSQRALREHEKELAIARRIQENLIPRVMPVLEGFAIAGASQPASATGGDCLDFLPLAGRSLLLALGDVSGHGLGPAILMAAARAYLRALVSTGLPLHAVLNLVNARLVEDMKDEFMTLFVGLIDPLGRSLTHGNAGHCPGIILDGRGDVRSTLGPLNLPLGIDPGEKYRQSAATPLLPGDLLLLVSDGVLEALAPHGEAFGMARILETVRASRHLPPAAIVAALLGAARAYAHGVPDDDMTAIVVKVAEGA